jgi:ABC-2 type transport system ATP-binding protein
VSPQHPKKPQHKRGIQHPPKPEKYAATDARRAAVARAAEAPPAKKKRTGPPPALGADELTKQYGELTALSPLDLDVAHGEAVVLVGHNGSGKTTFLRMASGLLEPTGGHVSFDGHAAGSLEARARVSYLPDNPTFYEDLSVWEHLEYVARLHGRDDWEQDAADLLGHLGLYERADDLPVTFSRGMRQKTSIALGFIRPFQVLLVDEPFVGLDASGKAALLDLLEESHANGAALLVATHELEFVKRVERCLALRDGVLTYDGTTDGIDVLGLVS